MRNLNVFEFYIFFRVSKSVVSQQYNLQMQNKLQLSAAYCMQHSVAVCLIKNQQTLFVNGSAKTNGIKDNTNNVQP